MPKPREWPDEKAFAYVKDRYDRGEPIDMHSFLEEDPEGKMAYTLMHQTRFGSWGNFLEVFKKFYKLDIDVDEIHAEANRRGARKRTIWSREKIRERVLQYSDERDVSYTGVLGYDRKLALSVNIRNQDGSKKYYESWNDVLSDCGLLHLAKKRRQSKLRIVREIKEYADEHGKENLVFEVAMERVHNLVNAAHRPDMFGSWIRAVEAAGFKYGPSWFSGKELPNILSNDSVRGMFSEKKAIKKKNAIIDAAVKK